MINGWCDECGKWVEVAPEWRCPNGHPYTSVRNHFYPKTNQPVAAPWLPEKFTPVAVPGYGEVPGTKEALLRQLAVAIVQQPGFAVTFGQDCDLLAHMEDRFASYCGWYEAKIFAVEAEPCVHIKERDGYTNFPDFSFRDTPVGEYWGWPRDHRLHSRGWAGDIVVHEHPLFWYHGDTANIVGSVAAAAGWAMLIDERRSTTDGWT